MSVCAWRGIIMQYFEALSILTVLSGAARDSRGVARPSVADKTTSATESNIVAKA